MCTKLFLSLFFSLGKNNVLGAKFLNVFVTNVFLFVCFISYKMTLIKLILLKTNWVFTSVTFSVTYSIQSVSRV